MKYYEMYDMYRFIRDELSPAETDEWNNYKEAMEKFFAELKPYFTPDKQKNYMPISEEEYHRLDTLFDDAVKASNDFTKSYKNIIEPFNENLPPIKEVAINFNNEFLSKAYVEYKNINPNPNFSLKDQMDDFRYVSVKLTSNEIKKLGAAQSDRTQMKVNIGGNEVNGVFTKKTFFDGKKELMPIFPRMAEKYPKYAKFFNGIDKEAFYKEGIQAQQSGLLFDKDGIPLKGEKARDAVANYFRSMKLTNSEMQKAIDFMFESDFYDAVVDFAGQISAVNTPIVIGKNRIGMKEGDRIDMRNSAMSGVATLLGCSNLLAKSRPLAIYDEQGKKYDEGTFMEFVTGKDINNLAPADDFRLMTDDDFETPEVKEQIADLQVLDFICGNVDRHAGNMFYDVDPVTHKLKGVVGIDNDSSFTRAKIAYNKTFMRLPGVNNLKVINEDMAKTITDLTEGQLKATLHGYGLDEGSIKAAWIRTQQLKQAINNGKYYDETFYIPGKKDAHKEPFITIIKKDDWKDLSLEQIHKEENNYFATIERLKKYPQRLESIGYHMTMKKEAAYAGLRCAMGKAQTKFLLSKAKDAAPWFFASARYKNILTKVKEYHEQKPEDPNNPLKNTKKWQKLSEMKEAINVYKNEKIRDGVIDENWNMKRDLTGRDLDRIKLVKDLETYVERIEKEKKSVEDIKKQYDEKKKYVDKINEFLMQPKEKQEKQIQLKLKEANKQEVKEDVIVASEISKNDSISIVKPEDNFLIKQEEVDINKIDKEVEVEEKNIQKEDIEKSL